MRRSSDSTEQENGYVRISTLIKEHFTWISAVVAALASLAGILNLLVFTRYIGRPDVFSRSLEFGPSLAVLLLTYLLIFLAIAGSMLITSYFFTLVTSWLRPKPEFAEPMIRQLFGMVVSGMLSIILVVMILAYCWEGPASGWWLLTVFMLPAILSWPFILVHMDHAKALSSPLTWAKKFRLCATLTGLVGGVALVGIFPAWYASFLYEESPDLSEWVEVIKFGATCLIAMAAPLAPAIGFYIKEKEGKSAQMKGALTGLLLFFALLTFTMPAMFSVTSVGSMNLLGISEREVRRHLVDNEQYPASSLNTARWSVTKHGDKWYSLNAFSLYAYGPINLLCPAELSTVRNRELRKHTKACIPFLKDEIQTLDAVEQGTKSATAEAASPQ